MHARVILLCVAILSVVTNGGSKVAPHSFIVSVMNEKKPDAFLEVEEWYKCILGGLTTATTAHPNIIYVYKTAFHGFSARLSHQQRLQLRSHHAVLAIIPDPVYRIQTTRSSLFLGLNYDTDVPQTNKLLRDSDQGSNIVVGIMDTGIWPESDSFRDDGMPPVPAHWKGECEGGMDISCNKKLVGVRYFDSGYNLQREGVVGHALTARDNDGHGTHTASTAAGRVVPNASFFGLAAGEARGIAPKARIAVYRVCSEYGCIGSDILAGMDKAIEDGVDILSLSLTGNPVRFSDDPIAMGAFSAVERGVLVSTSAGNMGPALGSVTNMAPWLTTIGASSIDRKFVADIVLDTGEVVVAESLYAGASDSEFRPLFYDNSSCNDDFEMKAVRGKLVVCKRDMYSNNVKKGLEVRKLGGVGLVVANTEEYGEGLFMEPYLTPGVSLPYSATHKLIAYINGNHSVAAKLVFRGTQIGVKPAPMVAYFSSRGPNAESRYILKPDLIGPGFNILAAWAANVSLMPLLEDHRRTQFNILSGTSMSCPHVSGIASLLKAAHPSWSPAMIRSALMTTARLQDSDDNPLLDGFSHKQATIWDTGAGQVDPNKAHDPGLVFDLTPVDYVRFLCASNYSDAEVSRIAKKSVTCSASPPSKPWDLNYPAIVVWVEDASALLNVVVRRSLTSVGMPSTYHVSVRNPKGATLTVDPPTMEFQREGQTHTFQVRISAKKDSSWFEVGALVWSDDTHCVNSPIVLGWGKPRDDILVGSGQAPSPTSDPILVPKHGSKTSPSQIPVSLHMISFNFVLVYILLA